MHVVLCGLLWIFNSYKLPDAAGPTPSRTPMCDDGEGTPAKQACHNAPIDHNRPEVSQRSKFGGRCSVIGREET